MQENEYYPNYVDVSLPSIPKKCQYYLACKLTNRSNPCLFYFIYFDIFRQPENGINGMFSYTFVCLLEENCGNIFLYISSFDTKSDGRIAMRISKSVRFSIEVSVTWAFQANED